MINAALIENDTVTNIIYIDQTNMDAFAAAGMELIDSAPLGLTMGDYRRADKWYRMIDGIEKSLPLEVTA